MWSIFIIYIIVGCVVGFMAGLLGIGGGSIIVPIVSYIAEKQAFNIDIIMKMSLGTSFAIIIMSTASSAWSHNKRGTILWHKIPYLGTGSAIGVIIGGSIVSLLSNTVLQVIFCIFLIYTIYSLLTPKKNGDHITSEPNHPIYLFILLGIMIGFLSSFIGIAGGAITVPTLVYIGYSMRQAIATSAVVGFILALFGSLTYIYTGWNHPDLPQYSLGFIYLPAFLGISILSIFMAPLGVKLSYKLPVVRIRQIFALFLAVILLRMVINFFS